MRDEDVECNDMNDEEPTGRLQQQQALSALLDGQGGEADLACRAWRDDAQLRADWHAYHLIGELMRSDDVRCAPQRDAQFLGRLRERLVAEPVVLAPSVAAAPARRAAWRRAWAAPMAMAAGFVAVAGVLVVTRVAAPEGAAQDRSTLAAKSQPVPPAAGVQAAAAGPSASGVLAVDGTLIRNAALDRYLTAHKQYSNTSALAVPGGMVRNAAVTAPGR